MKFELKDFFSKKPYQSSIKMKKHEKGKLSTLEAKKIKVEIEYDEQLLLLENPALKELNKM